jgi:hypothetical protein
MRIKAKPIETNRHGGRRAEWPLPADTTKEAFELMWAQRDKLEEMPGPEVPMSRGNAQALRAKSEYLKRDTGRLVWSEKLGKMVLRCGIES